MKCSSDIIAEFGRSHGKMYGGNWQWYNSVLEYCGSFSTRAAYPLTSNLPTDAMNFYLADQSVPPPTPFSYWVVPSRLLAGAYPGHPDPIEHQARIDALIAAGMRVFVNLMEANETNRNGQRFVSYDDIAAQRSPDATMRRHAICDLSIPTHNAMSDILDTIDAALANDMPVYVHCWGGVGRTGTVIGCWLLRHGLANSENVLKVLQQLRRQDAERCDRESPETDEQRMFVRQWLTQGA